MANCIKCGRKLPAFTFGKLRNVCKWCVEYEAMQQGGVDDDARQHVMPAPWAGGASDSMIVTKIFAGICAAVFVGMALSSEGKSIMEPSGLLLISWGANFGPLTLSGDWWRLLTSMFVHGDIIHIALNMWCLWSLGQMAESLYGRWTFAAVYLITGVAGSMVSVAHNPSVLSVGASGAVFGVAGALIASLKLGDFSLPREHVKATLSSVAMFAVYNLIFGAVGSRIDNAAHVGGLVAGLIIGALIALVAPGIDHTIRRITVVMVVAALVFGSGVLLERAFGAKTRTIRTQVLIATERYDQAAAELQKKLARDPKNVALYIELASVYQQQGRQSDQEAQLRRVISIDPTGDEAQYARYQLGLLLGKRQQYAEARQLFADMLSVDPKDAEAHLGLGSVLAAQKDHASAIKEFETAVQLGNNDFVLFYNMGNSFANLHKPDQAIEAYLKAVELDPKDPDVMTALADAYEAKGEKQQAEAARRTAESLKGRENQH